MYWIAWPVLSTTTMVSRPAIDRQILDLQNAASATGWIMFFVAKCRAGKKKDKVNNDGTAPTGNQSLP